MKRLSGLALLSLFCLVSPARAEVPLILPDNLKIVALNGENANLVENIQLPDGLKQIAVRLETEFGRTVDKMEMAYSDVFVMTFRASDNQLRLLPPVVHNTSQLKDFNRDPNLRLLDQNGKQVATRVAKLEKEGFQLMRNYQQELVVFNRSDSPAAIGISSEQQTSPREQTIRSANQSGLAEEMLKYWYQQADEASRERFKAWINQ